MNPVLRKALLTTSTAFAILIASWGPAGADPGASASPTSAVEASSVAPTPAVSDPVGSSPAPSTPTSPSTSAYPSTPTSPSMSPAPSWPSSPGASASASPTPPAGTTGSIAGTLTAATGGPLAWTGVYLQSSGSGTWYYNSTHTDADGHYTFTAVPPGTYTVAFMIPGGALMQYVPGHAAWYPPTTYPVTAGQTTVVDDTALPTGLVTGHLLDLAGAPVVSATVRPYDQDQGISGYGSTDASGAFSVPVFAGSYTIEFSFDGIRQYAPGQLGSGTATRYRVEAGATVAVEETAVATGSISGRLTQSDGTPAAGSGVYLTSITGDQWQSTTTATDGSYRFAKVAVGTYQITFVSTDFTRRQFAHGAVDSADAATITVAAGQDTTVDEAFLPTGTITITATNALTGAPITDFCTYLWAGGTEKGGCVDGTGRLTLTGVNAGSRHEVDVYDRDNVYLANRISRVTVTGGQETVLAVQLTPAAWIETTVVDAGTGAPVAGVCVHAFTLRHAAIGDSCAANSDEQGRVRFTSLAAGTYTLLAMPIDGVHGGQWVGATGGTGSQYLAAQLQVAAGQAVTAPVIRLDPAGTITGRVTDATTGAPVAGVCVATTPVHAAWGRIGYCSGGVTDGQGRYSVTNVGPYAWPVEFADNDMGGHAWQWSGGVTSRKRATTVQVGAGQSVTVDANLTGGTTVTARVIGPAGSLESNATVYLINAETGDAAAAFGIDENAFAIHALPQTVLISYSSGAYPSVTHWYCGGADEAHATPVRIRRKAMTVTLVVPVS